MPWLVVIAAVSFVSSLICLFAGWPAGAVFFIAVALIIGFAG